MRHKILELLRQKRPSYISGEEMANLLAVSRTSVWKNIQSLQLAGYEIEGSTRLGYRLLNIPDFLYPAEIAGNFHAKRVGSNPELIHHYHQVESTNTTLKNLADKDAPEGTIVVAEEQTVGRGRQGRSWSSPFGTGIWLSILLRPPLSPQETPVFTLLAATAAVRSLKRILPDLQVGIKWPNDLLINNRKVCGILTELKAEAEILHYLVLGIGINVNLREKDFPPNLRKIATSLYLENGGNNVSRQKLTSVLLHELDNSYADFLSCGPRSILAEWKKENITLGKNVVIKNMRGTFEGKAVDLNEDGSLIVEGEKGIRKHFHAGEVTIVPTNGG
ncbi:MAG: biotin--[acetyl-CoA-carboxylase] ligase [Bacillota bacterium]|nr:biotin--[acetyl-CoA-carboxylase] ligase [Bacillota bacterium]